MSRYLWCTPQYPTLPELAPISRLRRWPKSPVHNQRPRFQRILWEEIHFHRCAGECIKDELKYKFRHHRWDSGVPLRTPSWCFIKNKLEDKRSYKCLMPRAHLMLHLFLSRIITTSRVKLHPESPWLQQHIYRGIISTHLIANLIDRETLTKCPALMLGNSVAGDIHCGWPGNRRIREIACRGLHLDISGKQRLGVPQPLSIQLTAFRWYSIAKSFACRGLNSETSGNHIRAFRNIF